MKDMTQYILKSAVKEEIERLKKEDGNPYFPSETTDQYYARCVHFICDRLVNFLDTLEVKDPYEQCVQYDSIKAGIEAHAETYSFNIESMLFNQLTKEQQGLWREEIEQAVISGGEVGVELSNDIRYKENLEVKNVDLDNEYIKEIYSHIDSIKDTVDRMTSGNFMHNKAAIKFSANTIAKVLELMGLKAQKGE